MRTVFGSLYSDSVERVALVSKGSAAIAKSDIWLSPSRFNLPAACLPIFYGSIYR